MKIRNILINMMVGVVGISLPSCTGILGGLYDEPSDYGFVDVQYNTGTVRLNVGSYKTWSYVNFDTQEVITCNYQDQAPADWDIALHKADCKTDGGAAMETDFKDFAGLTASGAVPEGTFVPDQDGKIIVDMSKMQQGIIGYEECKVNEVIGRWLDTDTNTMPPIYTLSEKVYLVRLKDGGYLALKLIGYGSGSLTFQYTYPVQF